MAKKKTEVVKIKKDLLIKIGTGAAALLLIIPLILVGSRSIVYNNMNKKLQNIAYYSDLESIQSSLNFLPFDYRDAQQIRTELQMILNDVNLIRKSEIIKDYKRMRASYYNLELLNNTLYRWNITDLINNQNGLVPLIGRYGDNYDYFRLLPCENSLTNLCLGTSLPTNKDPSITYYYTNDIYYETFGYQNVDNKEDKFDSFKILGIYSDYIEIYNIKNKLIYKLNRIDD